MSFWTRWPIAKENDNHDPKTGQFSSGSGSGEGKPLGINERVDAHGQRRREADKAMKELSRKLFNKPQ